MFQLPVFKRAYLYQRPINMQWGEKKPMGLCTEALGLSPLIGEAYLFGKKKQDSLKLTFRDHEGVNDLQKLLPRGGFVLPAPSTGQGFTKIEPQLIQRLFR